MAIPVKNAPSTRNKFSAIALLFGYFIIFCALLLTAAGGWRWVRDKRQAGWPLVQATVDRCSLDENHPFQSEGGGTTYNLKCAFNFYFADATRIATVHTTSTRSLEVRDQIVAWTRRHRKGSALTLRVNPGDPSEVLIRGGLPIHQQPTPGEGFEGGAVFGLVGIALSGIGWAMRLRGR